MIEIALVVAVVLNLIIGYGVYNLIRTQEKYEDIVEIYTQGVTKLKDVIIENVEYVAKLDAEGHFQADDELGAFFEAMKESVDVIGVTLLEIDNRLLEIKDAKKEK